MGSWQKAVLLKGPTGPRGSLLYNDTYSPDSIYTQKATIGDYYLNTNTNTMYEYTSNISIAVGSNGESNVSIATSSNGLNWISASNNPFSNGQANAIGFNTSNLWVAVGKDSSNAVSIATSSNGYTWTPSLTNRFHGGEGSGVAWNGSLWVAVGKNSNSSVTLATSPNGSIWTSSSTNPFDGGQGLDVAWDGSNWLAVGSNSDSSVTAATSSNGSNWTASASPFPTGSVYGIAWNRSLWVAVGSNSDSTVSIVTSPDAATWTDSDNPFPGGTAYGISYNSSYWVVVGSNSNSSVTIARSSDAVTWTPSTNPFTGGYGTKVSWSGSYWLAVGKDSNGSVTVAISDDGLIWTATTNPFTSGIGYGIVSGGKWVENTSLGTNIYSGITVPESNDLPKKLGDYYLNTTTKILYKYEATTLSVVVGYNSNYTQSIATSLDGYTWSYSLTNPFSNARAVAWNGSYLCAVGDTTAISVDGLNWSSTTNPFSNGYGYGIAWNGSYWLVVGSNGTATAAISPDTSVWTSSDPFTGGAGYGIAWDGSNWCAVGSNSDSSVTVATSSDGLTWTSADVFTGGVGKGIAWNGSYWAAVGSNSDSTVTIATSPDGVSWTGIDIFNNGVGNGIAWNGSYWVAVGRNNSEKTAARSPDGINWILSTPFYNGRGYGISWNGSLWFAVGNSNLEEHSSGSSISTSPDGLNWTTSSFILNPLAILNNTVQTRGWNTITTLGSSQGLQGSIIYNGSSPPSYESSSNIRIGDYYIDTNTNQLYQYDYVSGFIGVGNDAGQSISLIIGYNESWIVPLSKPFAEGNKTVGLPRGIAWNGSYWLSVGYNMDRTLTSSKSLDGISWISSEGPFLGGEGYGIAWNGSYWCAVGNNAAATVTVATSPDGLTWTGIDVFTGGAGYGIAWNGSYWVAVGTTSTVTASTSSDGSNWINYNPFPSGSARGIAWNGSEWLAVGNATDGMGISISVATSPDGSNWTSSEGPFPSGEAYGIAWNGTYWCAVGYTSNLSNSISTSSDGLTWSYPTEDPFTGYRAYAVAWNSNREIWCVVGENGIAATSSNGSDWIYSVAFTSDSITGGNGHGITSGNIFTWILLSSLAGSAGPQGSQGDAGPQGSQGSAGSQGFQGESGSIGLNIDSNFPLNPSLSNYHLDITTNVLYQYKYTTGSTWIIAGANYDYSTTIILSSNGTDWISAYNDPFSSHPQGRAYSIAHNGSYWLVGGYSLSTTVAKSIDGSTWFNFANPFSLGSTRGIFWNGNFWGIVGSNQNSTVTAAISAGGVEWITSDPFSGGRGNKIAWNGSYWIAVGRNSNSSVTITKSADAFVWTSADNPFSGGEGLGIAWNGSLWIAVGSNSYNTITIGMSSDGESWNSTTAFSGGVGNAIAWNGSYWVAVGRNSNSSVTVSLSSDGFTWTPSVNNPFADGSGKTIAWNGSNWIAGGSVPSTSKLARSTDGSNWTDLDTPLPSGFIEDIKYINSNQFLAWVPVTNMVKGKGNVLIVDAVYGNDSTASVNKSPFATVQAALSNASSGKIIYIYPGTYTLSAGITIPNGVSICGISEGTVTIQMNYVTSDTTLVTMEPNALIENISFVLTSLEHHTLKGIVFTSVSAFYSKVRNCSIIVTNASALVGGTSTVTGIEFNGTGILGPETFAFNNLEACTIKVYSNGSGNKRGILVSNTNIATARDINVFVSHPGDPSSTGSYVGVETNDASSLGSIQLRSTTIGTVAPTSGQTYTASDILQTTPATITNPTYLASAGIQIGPGTDLVTKRAGGLPFSTYNYPTIIYYGLKGDIKNATNGWLWPGTQAVSASFPDPATPAAYFRAQQPCIICGLAASLTGAPGTGHSVTLLVDVTPSGGSRASTTLTLTFGATDINKTYYATTHSVNTGDRIHLYLTYTGNNDNTAHDLTCQIDLF